MLVQKKSGKLLNVPCINTYVVSRTQYISFLYMVYYILVKMVDNIDMFLYKHNFFRNKISFLQNWCVYVTKLLKNLVSVLDLIWIVVFHIPYS